MNLDADVRDVAFGEVRERDVTAQCLSEVDTPKRLRHEEHAGEAAGVRGSCGEVGGDQTAGCFWRSGSSRPGRGAASGRATGRACELRAWRPADVFVRLLARKQRRNRVALGRAERRPRCKMGEMPGPMAAATGAEELAQSTRDSARTAEFRSSGATLNGCSFANRGAASRITCSKG